MPRYDNPTTGRKSQFKVTDPVYGNYDPAEVDSGLRDGSYVLMERTVHAKINGQMVPGVDQRFMAKDLAEKKKLQGWREVQLSGSQIAATVPKAPEGGGKKAPAASAKETR